MSLKGYSTMNKKKLDSFPEERIGKSSSLLKEMSQGQPLESPLKTRITYSRMEHSIRYQVLAVLGLLTPVSIAIKRIGGP